MKGNKMKVVKILSILLLVAIVGALIAGNMYLYKKMECCKENQQLVQEVDQMKENVAKSEHAIMKLGDEIVRKGGEIAKLHKEVKATECAFLEAHKNLATAVDKLEDWVESSSVQGKWNGYKRQMGELQLKMKDYYNQVKESVKQKIESIYCED